MTILLSRIAPRGQPVDFHAPLGEIEWQRTIKHIEATLSHGQGRPRAPHGAVNLTKAGRS